MEKPSLRHRFSAVYGAQFDLGPLSKASIGNVQMHLPATGVVDLVVQRIEGLTGSGWLRLVMRGTLNPARSFANLMRLKVPWYRDDRGGVFRP